MGFKVKPAYTLISRDHCQYMNYTERKAYNQKALAPLQKKCDRLLAEVVSHLVRMRVKHEVYNGELSIFPDADSIDLRHRHVSFTPVFYNWPDVPSGQLRLTFMKPLASASPTWFRVKKVSVLEPIRGFDTLSLAKDLQALRKDFIANRKLRNIQSNNIKKSRRLAESVVIPEDINDKFDISTSASHKDPDRFELRLTYTVNKKEAQAVLDRLRDEH